MNAKDQLKVIRQGFTIYRMEESRLIIKYKDLLQPEWKIYDRYKSKAEMKRDMEALLTDNLSIED